MSSRSRLDDCTHIFAGTEPLSRATRKKKAGDEGLQSAQNVAAIDFGTTFVSLAYATHDDDKINLLPLHSTYERVPNAILLQNRGKPGAPAHYSVVNIGFDAQTSFCRLPQGQVGEHVYFERVKMLLERDETVNRGTTVPSFTGGEYYLIEVIAFILKHLKKCLLSHLPQIDGTPQLKSSDFEWVITVPAIWKARAKRMMREAAYIAGLTSDREGITTFTPVGRELPRPIEENPDKLSLALEPEVAAICAQSDHVTRFPPERYMVVDIGGGTVDITVHDQKDGKVNVVLPPSGNAWGGTTVNEAFKAMLEDIVCDRGFQKFLNRRPSNKAELNRLVYNEFDSEKCRFGKEATREELTVNLPNAIVDFYKGSNCFETSLPMGVEYEDDSLFIETSLVEAKLFQPTIDGIVKCTTAALEKLTEKVDTIYLVGGFGGCQYIYRKVKEAIGKYQGLRYDHIIRPNHPQLAIATGAVMWRRDPGIIQSRRADATYGIGASIPFDSSRHDTYYMHENEDGKKFSGSVFKVFLQRGESVAHDDIFVTHQIPSAGRNRTATVTIYSTPNVGVQYIRDKERRPTVKKIGELQLKVPSDGVLTRRQRILEICMDFSGTEIQARVRNQYTGEVVKTVCDFLSSQEMSF